MTCTVLKHSGVLHHITFYCVLIFLVTSAIAAPPQIIYPSQNAIITIPENTKVGYMVCKIYVSNPNNDTLTVWIRPAALNFRLNGTELTTLQVFDYEIPNDRTHNLILSVSDNTSIVTNHFTVEVTNLNDNYPILSGSFSIWIQEEWQIGKSIPFHFTASDADDGDVLTYVLKGSDARKFGIDSRSGTISVAERLDRDIGPLFFDQLRLEVTDMANHIAVANLNVSLYDINDNAPFCNPTWYFADIREAEPNGTSVVTVTCSDIDEGPNKDLTMNLQGTIPSKFKIDKNGKIRTTAILDYESIKGPNFAYELKVLVSDNPRTNGISLTTTATVIVKVQPYNEFPPIFQATATTCYLDENKAAGSWVTTVTATDKDKGKDGEVSYTLWGSSGMFTIDPQSGEIRTKRALDREKVQSYQLQVIALDGGNNPSAFSSMLNLTVNVNDVNDNVPSCPNRRYLAVIAEGNLVGVQVHHIVCTDHDNDPSKINDAIRYAIINGHWRTPFTINSTTGLVTATAVLDREVKSFYELTIRVSDLGVPQLYVDLILTIYIHDVNDNPPVFTSSNYTTSVSEKTKIGSVVLSVTANDKDIGPAGSFLYNILSGNNNNQFVLDSVTGELKLISLLDREHIESYSLLVQATDKGSPPMTATSYLTITVIDENDNAPLCTSSYYTKTLFENTSLSSVVTTLTCSDADSGPNALITYSIVSGNHRSVFAIGPQTNQLTVIGGLDAETRQHYLLEVDVSNKKYITKVKVEISLIDVNEYPPDFVPPGPYHIAISEGTAIGSSVFRITATDKDVSIGAVLYSFTTLTNVFSIDQRTGVIKLNGHLDRETNSSYTLQVEVNDNSQPHPLSNSTHIKVNVIDVNDNSPSCTKSDYLVSLRESTTFSHPIVTINCSDVDSSSPILTYIVESGNNVGLFQINTSTGEIKLTKVLDYERAKTHTLGIRVDDNGPKKMSTKVRVIVKVRPLNEFTPVFIPATGSSVTVDENARPGMSLITILAKDQDLGEDHGTVGFTIKSGDQNGHFSIDSKTGLVSLVKNLDRETKDNFRLTVLAKDCLHHYNSTSLTGTTTLVVHVADVNDNYPEFTKQNYFVSVNENVRVGTSLLIFEAHDDDSGPRGTVTFSIANSNFTDKFMIIGSNLAVNGTLDYEKTPYFRLRIKVTDHGTIPLSSHAYANIQVKPRNEFPPVFLSNTTSLVLNETLPVGSVLCKINVTDKDTGTSNSIDITIDSAKPINAPWNSFEIDRHFGEITLINRLDYELLPNRFSLFIKAVDQVTPPDTPLSSTMTLSITILNENDHVPVFTRNTYNFQINENSNMNTYVDRVSAKDLDFGTFGVVTYDIIGGITDFTVHATNGKIFVNTTLDYELKQLYFFVVVAQDQGAPAKSSSCFVRISILDINDNVPVFTPTEQSLQISEDVPINTFVTRVQVSDADSIVNGNNIIRYRHSEPNSPQNHFAIDASTGVIRTVHTLDRETMAHHDLLVFAVDGGSPPLTGTSTISVIVEDVNDNSPVITGQYRCRISEDTPPGIVVFKFTAFDRDAGVNGDFSFNIVSGNTNSDFKIDTLSGYLLTNRSLNRERSSDYSLQIGVTDHGQNSRNSIKVATIVINDVNDNQPDFLKKRYNFSISENLPSMTSVGQLLARDADEGSNAALRFRIIYMLIGPYDFIIDGGTGIISSKTKLDRESVSSYKLWCEVADHGVPSLSAFTEVTIAVSDVNDHEPVFLKNSYSKSLKENVPVDTTVMKFNVTDEDLSSFGHVTLSILPNVADAILAKSYFEIKSGTQSLVLKKQIDREKIKSFKFVMLAEDGGIPRLTAQAAIDIFIGDRNDHAPHFSPIFFSVETPNDGSCSRVLAYVSAVDPDQGDNGKIAYYFVQSKYNYLFSINDNTGAVAMQMEAAKNAKYIIVVQAKDWGTPEHVSDNNATLRIDTFDPKEVGVSIKLGINSNDFNLEKETFLQQLTALLQVKYPTGQFKLWCVQERDGVARQSIGSMRRLAATSSTKPVTVHVYCLKSNSSTNRSNLVKDKDFCNTAEALSFLTVDGSGEISDGLKGPAWDYFDIEEVKTYGDTDKPSWLETTEGIVITTLSSLLFLFLIAVSILIYCNCRKNQKTPKVHPNVPSVQEKLALAGDIDSIQKNNIPPVLAFTSTTIDPNRQYLDDFRPSTNFDGRALDPVTGKLYEYNTNTNERRWVTTSNGLAVKLTNRI